MDTLNLTKSAARSQSRLIVKLRSNNDPAWMDNLLTFTEAKGHVALGFVSVESYTTATLTGIKYRWIQRCLSASRSRRVFSLAGVQVDHISIKQLSEINDPQRVVNLVSGGMTVHTAIDFAHTDDRGLINKPSSHAPRQVAGSPLLDSLALTIEALAYTTPVADLRKGEGVLLACLEGLTVIVETLNIKETK